MTSTTALQRAHMIIAIVANVMIIFAISFGLYLALSAAKAVGELRNPSGTSQTFTGCDDSYVDCPTQ